MKLTVNKPCEIEAIAIKCEMAVRYDEEDIPNDFPLRNGDMWDGTIDIDTGIIRNWPEGKSGELSMKVCDEGTYTLLGVNDEVLAKRENNYVPSCVPEQYGDYVEFSIDETGKIFNWSDYCTPENIVESFFGDEE
jgi:hypothetical protein